MRLDHHTHHEHRTRQQQQQQQQSSSSTNGSSSSSAGGVAAQQQNGASPHHTNSTNGPVVKAPATADSETNGVHTTATNGHTTPSAAIATVERNTAPFHGHDREEVTRILLQSLSDLGYHAAARQLSDESGYALEIPSVAAFRNAVLRGLWEEAEGLLFGVHQYHHHLHHGYSEDVGGERERERERDGGVVLGNGHAHNHSRSLSQGAGAGASSSWRKSSSSSSSSRMAFGTGSGTAVGGAVGSGSGNASQNGFARHGLPLAEGADTTTLKFLLRQQKYLELLEERDLNAALLVLRNELTPLKRDIGRLHALSSLMMCPSASDLRTQADWDGAQGSSRSLLLSEISTSISPSVMIPEHRLATLFTAVQQEQILNCRYHNTTVQPSLYTDHECLADDFPLQTLTELRDHADEVWFVEFSHDGSMLATAGKDGLVCVYDTLRWSIRHQFREHERTATSAGDRGVCCVAFSPDDQYLISCSQNNEFVVVNVHDGRCVSRADHFDYPVTSAAWLPDSQSFVIGTQGSRRPLGLYSLRPNNNSSSSTSTTSSSSGIVKNNEIYTWRDPPWDPTLKDSGNPVSFRITDCAISPDGVKMVATTIDNKILMYDLRTKLKVAEWQMENKLSSINFGADGGEMLVNMNKGKVMALSAATGEVVCRYEGVRQEDFVIRSCFGGAGEGFVVSGSEDSRVYIWRRQTGMQVAALDAHAPGAVNAVAWHPTNPSIFASAGDDRRVRIWAAASTTLPRTTTTMTGVGAGASRTSLSAYER